MRSASVRALLTLSLLVLVADQATKVWALSRLTHAFDGDASWPVVTWGPAPEPAFDALHFAPRDAIIFRGGVLSLRYAENRGAAFGLAGNVPESLRLPLFHLLSLSAVVLVLFYARTRGAGRLRTVALALVLGGSLGNYVDRLARGFVIDFVQLRFLPALNLADASIVLGVLLLLTVSLRPNHVDARHH